MPDLRYATAREIPVIDIEIGDQMLGPSGFRVVHDITDDPRGVRISFWDEEPIVRREDSRVRGMKWTAS
jgi:hypothetical protein